MPKRSYLVPIIVENEDGPKPQLHSVLKPSPPPEALPPSRTRGVDTAAGAVRGAVGAASTVASTAVSAAATTVGFFTKRPMIGEKSEDQKPASEESSKATAGHHSHHSLSDSDHPGARSPTTDREKRKWEILRAVGNPMMQTVCFVLTLLTGLLMIALLAYVLLRVEDKRKATAAHLHGPTVTADREDTTQWFPLPPAPPDYPNGTGA
ncbi:uncharacterized protein LOC119173837 [Rhipicephalus microplus]|uniref:uncharacterized protein LOC119173837 n=1 Tax=Rhipicephalus microplus TaxID=6941 RepID=UPI003F6C090F